MIAAEFDALSAELSAAPLDEAVRRRAALVACAQARDAESRGRSRARPAPPRPRRDHNLHGHMVGIDRHLRSGSLLCARCQELFDDLVASGILREVTQ